MTGPAIVILGSLSGYLSNSGFGNPWFDAVEKPAFMPPGWVFGTVWPILYALMGIALARVWTAIPSKARSGGLTFFALQLFLNYAWSPIFFGAGAIDWGLVVIIAMAAAASVTVAFFWRADRVAALLLIPYLLWLCVATALNVETGRLNPGADRAPLGLIGGR